MVFKARRAFATGDRDLSLPEPEPSGAVSGFPTLDDVVARVDVLRVADLQLPRPQLHLTFVIREVKVGLWMLPHLSSADKFRPFSPPYHAEAPHATKLACLDEDACQPRKKNRRTKLHDRCSGLHNHPINCNTPLNSNRDPKP